MDANKFRESVISAIKYMAFFKKHVCTFSKPIEVEYGFNGEKQKVIPTICFVEVPDEEIEELEKVIKKDINQQEPINYEEIDALFTTTPTSVVKVVKDEAELKLPSKETYVSGLHVPSYDFREWSDPIYQCPEDGCDGGMCENLTSVCACIPPKYEYRCNKCGHTDYLPQ